MKRLLKTLFFLFIVVASQGQYTLTIRQAFNFDIGDEFHYTGSIKKHTSLQSILRKRILSKQFSTNGDTVFYTVERTERREAAILCYNVTDTVTESYTDLDSLCLHLFVNNTPNVNITEAYCGNGIPQTPPTFSETPNGFFQQTLFSVHSSTSFDSFTRDFAEGMGLVTEGTFLYYGSYCTKSWQMVYAQKGVQSYGNAITALQTPIALPSMMSRGEVYDFEVGDIFQFTAHSQGSLYAQTMLHQKRILQKQQANDTVTYSVELSTLVLSSSFGNAGTYTKDTMDVVYENLSQSAVPDVCGVLDDSLNDCQRRETSYYITSNPGISSTTRYIRGCGSYAVSYTFAGISSETLTYYYKAASNETCGTYQSLGTGVEAISGGSMGISAYYIPANSALSVRLPAQHTTTQVGIFNAVGVLVHQAIIPAHTDLQQISVALPSGIYVVAFVAEGQVVSTKFVVE